MLACALAVLIALPKRLIGMYLAQETAQADAAATLGFRHGLFDRDALGAAALRRDAGLRQHACARWAKRGSPMLASVAAILVNLVFNYFLIFGKCGFPEIGRDGRGDCDGAFALCGNGRSLWSIRTSEISSFWLYTRCIQKPARAEVR